MEVRPPYLIRNILKKLSNKDLWESIEGDLYELYCMDVESLGKKKARKNYIINALAFLRFRRLRNQNSKTQITMDLFINYFKVSWRDLKRHKLFGAINLIGLVAGFTSSLLLLQYVFFETSFDDFHENKENIYRVINDRYQNGNLVQHGTITYPTIGPTMTKDFPEVESYTRMTVGGRRYIKRDQDIYMLENFLTADEHFLTFFNFPTAHGDAATMLDEPGEMVFTKSYAKRFLNTDETYADLVGQTVTMSRTSFIISGIIEDVPDNSHLQFDVLVSYETMVQNSNGHASTSWEWSDFYHYIKVKDGTKPALIDEKLIAFGKKYFKEGEVSGGEEKFYLQPLQDAHLYSDYEYEIGETANGEIVWLMFGISLFILLIAWINFINLSTSRASERAKEISLRKTLGAVRQQILIQSFTECFLINIIALIISFGLVWMLQDVFRNLTSLPLKMSFFWTTEIWSLPFPIVFIAGFLLCLVLISFYPSIVLGRFKIQEVIKGRFGVGSDAILLRKGLVIFQFVATVLLVVGSITVYQQVSYMQNKDLGMNMENTLVLYGPSLTRWDSTYIDNFEEFKQDALRISGVQSVSSSSRLFSQQLGRIFQIHSARNPEVKNLTTNHMQVDHSFIEQFDIEMVAGRSFEERDHGLDPNLINTCLINEASLKMYGFENALDAVGEKLIYWGRTWEVVGVVKNFHQRSLHSGIEPILFMPYYGTDHYYSIKLSEKPNPNTILTIQESFGKFYPGNYIDYFYMDDLYQNQYQEDRRVQSIAQLFTFMAIIIALLGLYGLILITMNRKTKEIAVRKVLGARLVDLLSSLGKEFLIIIAIAILIGLPISYLLLSNWLDNYAYHVSVEWTTLLVAAIGLIVISSLTIIFQTGKVTSNNPAESLKYE